MRFEVFRCERGRRAGQLRLIRLPAERNSLACCSEYLLRSLRTLPEGCRDITAAHPELPVKDCHRLRHAKLRMFYDVIERGGCSAGDRPEELSFGLRYASLAA
jgi:hypothetical protein